ncbi:CD1107 family mobile element protein [Bacillus paramycoides]|uniref:CD1107 family mobile element protein n=1 Tax=Bacillus paramycoides TaxID=2026194 RepID=UPI003D042085
MLKLTKRSFFATVLMCSLSFASVSNFAYAEENKTETQKVTENKSVGEPPSGPGVTAEKKEKEVEAQTPASVNGKKVDGTGTVTDFTTSGSKAFYTITDKDSNVFYLIVDLDKTQNNVYFLSDVKKTTLDGTAAATTSKDGTSVKPNVPNQKQAEADKTTANTQTASEKPKEESNNNSFLLIVLALAIVGVAGYYFLVMKKKKNQNKANEDEEVMEDDYYEDNFEDERKKNNKED